MIEGNNKCIYLQKIELKSIIILLSLKFIFPLLLLTLRKMKQYVLLVSMSVPVIFWGWSLKMAGDSNFRISINVTNVPVSPPAPTSTFPLYHISMYGMKLS
jgi:hypothetical protein